MHLHFFLVANVMNIRHNIVLINFSHSCTVCYWLYCTLFWENVSTSQYNGLLESNNKASLICLQSKYCPDKCFSQHYSHVSFTVSLILPTNMYSQNSFEENKTTSTSDTMEENKQKIQLLCRRKIYWLIQAKEEILLHPNKWQKFPWWCCRYHKILNRQARGIG